MVLHDELAEAAGKDPVEFPSPFMGPHPSNWRC